MVYSYYFCDNTSKKGEFTFHHCCDRTERENDTWYGPNKIKNSKELSLCVISSTYLALRLSPPILASSTPADHSGILPLIHC